MPEFIVVGLVEIPIIKKINAYRSVLIPDTKDLDIVVDIKWFSQRIQKHYLDINEMNSFDKIKRILKKANHILYGSFKDGLLYIEMNSSHQEILILGYNPKSNQFKALTLYRFSNKKLIDLIRSKNVHHIK